MTDCMKDVRFRMRAIRAALARRLTMAIEMQDCEGLEADVDQYLSQIREVVKDIRASVAEGSVTC